MVTIVTRAAKGSPLTHAEVDANFTNLSAAIGGGSSSVAWDDVTDKPGTFPPSAHTHVIADVTGLQTALDGKQAAGSYQPLSAVLSATTASFTTALESKLAGIAAGATVNSSDASLRDRSTHTGAQAISTVTGLQTALDGKQPLATVLTNTTAAFTTAQETKLAGIAAGATVNASDAALRDRATHTGTQTASTISDFDSATRAQTEAALVAGSNVTITPSGSGAARQLTLAAIVPNVLRLMRGTDALCHIPVAGGTTVGVIGAAALTLQGTATAASIADTNAQTRRARIEYLVTAAATNAVAGYRLGTVLLRTAIGYRAFQRWGPATGVSGATTRAFFGICPASAFTDVNPSTRLNIFGMGWDNGDTNVQIMHNDGSGAATKIDLGASFPRPSADRTNMYDVEVYCPPGGASMTCTVRNLTNSAEATETITTNMPPTGLTFGGAMSVGGTSSVIGIAFGGSSIELLNN